MMNTLWYFTRMFCSVRRWKLSSTFFIAVRGFLRHVSNLDYSCSLRQETWELQCRRLVKLVFDHLVSFLFALNTLLALCPHFTPFLNNIKIWRKKIILAFFFLLFSSFLSFRSCHSRSRRAMWSCVSVCCRWFQAPFHILYSSEWTLEIFVEFRFRYLANKARGAFEWLVVVVHLLTH